jgi:hypothetical protein
VEATPNPRTPRDPRATATTAAIARHKNGLQPLRLILAEPCSRAAAGGRLPFMPLFCPEGISCPRIPQDPATTCTESRAN